MVSSGFQILSSLAFLLPLVQLGGESNGQRHGEGRPRSPLYSYPYMCGLVRDDTTKADRVDGGKESGLGKCGMRR